MDNLNKPKLSSDCVPLFLFLKKYQIAFPNEFHILIKEKKQKSHVRQKGENDKEQKKIFLLHYLFF